MANIKLFFFVVLFFVSFNIVGQHFDNEFKKVYELIQHKDFFKAKVLYRQNRDKLSPIHQSIVEVFLENAFNQIQKSNQKISHITSSKNLLPDSLWIEIYKIKEDNSVKLFDYKEAKKCLETLLKDYKNALCEDESKELKNKLKIWSALADESAQIVNKYSSDTLEMIKDKAGLNNLEVITTEKDTIPFVFDTGANLSTVSESIAKKMHIKKIYVDIEVGTMTGENVVAQLGICPAFKLGKVEIQNAVFLILKDSDLIFDQINYQINGILGFPIIEGLREIQLTNDNRFIIPKSTVKSKQYSNMALDGLTPLISIEGRSYTFDTGASQTILYQAYYADYKKEIDNHSTATKLKFAGAAGAKEFEGYIINPVFNVFNKKIELKNVQLLKSKITHKETAYGNIGQDFINQFNKFTINFDQMSIMFD